MCISDTSYHEKCVVVTGPASHPIQVGIGEWQTPITHEEADVIMACHMIQEATMGHSPISMVIRMYFSF